MSATILPIVLLAAFQGKHVLADFYWQSRWMVQTKGIYGHPGGLLHSGLHVALSAPILAFAGLSPGLILGLLLVEFVIHYHTDWAKDRIVRSRRLQPTEARFWNLTGLDQFVHHMTYVGLTAVVALTGVPH